MSNQRTAEIASRFLYTTNIVSGIKNYFRLFPGNFRVFPGLFLAFFMTLDGTLTHSSVKASRNLIKYIQVILTIQQQDFL